MLKLQALFSGKEKNARKMTKVCNSAGMKASSAVTQPEPTSHLLWLQDRISA
jgi:Ethanolamine utilization protein EutJ (predicted chaperonin)